MSDSQSRFWKTLRNLGLALLNATLILVIAAALSIGFAAYSVRDFAETTAQRAASAAVEAAGLEPGRLANAMDTLSDEVTALRRAVTEDGSSAATIAKFATVNAQLERVRLALEQISRPEITISEETLDRISGHANKLLSRFQSCPSENAPLVN